jgi:hypothetical protein
MKYTDFTIDLSSRGAGQYEAKVVKSPFGDTAPTVFSAPIAEEVLKAIEESFSGNKEVKKDLPSDFELGRQLYSALFQNGLEKLFVRAQERLGNDAGLRIRLRFRLDDDEVGYLGTLPWELLCKPSAEFLSTDLGTPVVREIQTPKRYTRLAVTPPLRILVVDSPTCEYDKAKQKQETDLLFEALQPLVDAKQVELRRLKEPRLDLLLKALRKETVHVLHFMGHGGFDADSGAGAVFFAAPGKKQQVDAEVLADYLKVAPDLRLVVINSCLSARHAGYLGAPYNYGVAAIILERTKVRAVLANQYAITHGTAIELTRRFYEGIAMGDGVDTAITGARMQIRHRSREWATPVLFLNARDGKLFDFKPAEGPSPVETLEPQREETMPLHLGIRSIDGWGRDMESQANAVLDFVPLFEDRFIKRKESWQEEIFPRLKDFFRQHVDERRPLLLDFAAHSSIAFAAGWLLEAKSGLDVRVRQRIQGGGALDWHPDEGGVPDSPLWLDEPDLELAAGAPDIALALAVSQPELAVQVQDYVQRKGLPVGRVLRATIAPAPGARSVQGGAHALRLAQSLLPAVRQRRPHERGGCVHIFGAAPNALLFYLGQLSRSFGRIVLYEHPFGAADAWGKYQPSIRLEASAEPALDPEDW